MYKLKKYNYLYIIDCITACINKYLMSYPEVSDNFLQDILSRKELYSLKADPERNFRDPPDAVHDGILGKYLKIHSHQLFVRNFMNPNTPYKRLHLEHATGCHATGTPILMFDGTIKRVEDIIIGDKLMGDDNKPRNVLRLVSNREKMYEVVPENGPAFTCNIGHILTLTNGVDTIDISINDYLENPLPGYKLFRIGIEFPEIPVDTDPYLMGSWIGGIISGRIKPLVRDISYNYRCNSHTNRMKLLRGIVKSAAVGNKIQSSIFDNDIIYVCRSLGVDVRRDDGFIHIIDMKPRTRMLEFKMVEKPIDTYYGFELDGNRRYLLGCFTVTHNTGKTLAAISITQEFTKVYKKMYAGLAARTQAGRRNYGELDRNTPTVFVLGFGGTKSAFVRELLRHPEFGFISLSEKDELIKRQKIADAGLPDDIKQLKEFYSHLKKRITNKSKDGFYKFFGYDEFVNRLFSSDNVKLTDLEAIAIQKLKAGENVTLEDVFYDHIKSGKIQVNQQLLKMFEDSLVICDEIHNTYNMNMKNNRGVAIQYILDTIPNVRFLSMSATPINNSPSEAVELVNYLVLPHQKITKKGFFSNSRTLLPGKLEELGRLTKGKISFLQDVNVKYFPKRNFIGNPIIIPKDVENFPAGTPIPYLKFIECPMSDFHQDAYNHFLQSGAKSSDIMLNENTVLGDSMIVDISENNNDKNTGKNKDKNNAKNTGKNNPTDVGENTPHDDEVEEIAIGAPVYSYHSIPTDGYSIYDIAFPNPDGVHGIFRSSEVRNKIAMASQEWKDENKITIKKFSVINSIITGDFLLRENIGKYSTKAVTLIDTLKEIIGRGKGNPNNCEKIMIYHDRVKMSGVLFIQELLHTNNILDEFSEPVDSTLCCLCGESMSSHNDRQHDGDNNSNHTFRPVRFVMAHSDIDKATMDQSLAKFNSPDNAHGQNFQILVGSKIIKESYDFKDIQNLIIMSLPVNIPTLMQVFGRCIRKNSHINLPPEQRRVDIRILISTMGKSGLDSISPEMYRYIDKLSDYMVIQSIEREFNRNAIDADIHRDIIMPPALLKEFFPDGKNLQNTLGNLYFEPALKVPEYTLGDLNLATFNAYKYYEEEIKIISFLIKRLFMVQPVWTYEDLWEHVRKPPFGIEVNPKLFVESNFVIALNNLVSNAITIINVSKQKREMTETILTERLFDTAERYIYTPNGRYKIEQVDKYYILFPVADIPNNPLNIVHAEYIEHVRDKERAMIKELVEPNDRIINDVETYLRPLEKRAGTRINIETYVKESKANINYLTKKQQFIESANINKFLTDYSAQFQMSFCEEAITYMMLGAKAVPAPNNVYKLYESVIELLNKFRVIVYLKEIAKYRDTAKQYKNGLPHLPDNTPLGYMTAKSVRLFDPQTNNLKGATPETVERGKWIEVSKISLNRQIAFKENEIIVGYLESAEDHMRFKLRKPIQKIKSGDTNDTRLIERGIVCGTKNKRDLLRIISSLGISMSKLDKNEIRIRNLCEIIKSNLITSEARERQKDSKYKYLYSWWDESVDLASQV